MSTESYPAILTKENFFNELQEKYPVEMKKFCDWVDEYKKRINWEVIFGTYMQPINPPGPDRTPKFHEIPVAMQIGIFIQFVTEQKRTPDLYDGIACDMEAFIFSIQVYFETVSDAKD